MATQALWYTAYGHSRGIHSLLLGFNGQPRLANPPAYALGNGHRVYSPTLMRFFSPDTLSPFEVGGLNAYCYCEGDPINNADPTGTTRVKTGLTAEFKRLNIPKVFKPGVKEHFKTNPNSTRYHLGIGEAGFVIKKTADGRFEVTRTTGLGVTHDLLKKSQARSKQLEGENLQLRDRIKELGEQARLPKPLHPLPPPPSRPPKPVRQGVDPTSIRQP